MVNNELNKANCDQLAMLMRNSTEDEKRAILYCIPISLLLEIAHERSMLYESHLIEEFSQMKRMENEFSAYSTGNF